METFIAFILTLFGSWFGGVDINPKVPTDAVSAPAEVVRVIDGDTIEVLIDGVTETVRYIGIDTPEPYRGGEPACFSGEATERNRELVGGQVVQLVPGAEDRDRFDRLLRYVYINDQFVNELLVAEGFATTMRIEPNTSQAEVFNQAQSAARSAGLGLWSACGAAASDQVADTAADTSPILIDTSSLPPTQQRIISTLGIDESTIGITPTMIECAQAAVGADRLAAITGGDTPSIVEGFRLANCYRTN